MPQFNVGDQVERIGALIDSPYLRSGVVIRVLRSKDCIDWLTEYVIVFDEKDVAILYETELQLVNPVRE